MDLILVGFVAGLTFGGWRTGFLSPRGRARLYRDLISRRGISARPIRGLIHGLFPDMPGDYAELIGYAFLFPILLMCSRAGPPVPQGPPRGRHDSELDRALGAIFGFIEAVLILSVLVVIFDTYFAGFEQGGQTPGLALIQGPWRHSTSLTRFRLFAGPQCRWFWPCLGRCCPRTSRRLFRRVCLGAGLARAARRPGIQRLAFVSRRPIHKP